MMNDLNGLLGVFVGVVASVPVVLVLVMLHRANERATWSVVSSAIAPQNTPERTTGHYVAVYDAGARGAPASMALTGHSGPVVDAEWREYGFSAPRIERGTQTVRQYRRNRLGPGTGAIAAVEITHSTPHREPNAGADLLVPLGQAVATGIIAALLAGVLALLAGRSDALRIVGGVFVVTLAAAWLWRLGVVDSLLHVIETITQNLDNDDEPEPDPAHAMTMNAGAARSDAARKERSSERALRLADLLAFAQRCSTVGCSERSQGVRAGTPQQEAYRAKRDLLIQLGIGRWKNPENHNLGWVLTVKPAAAAELLRRHVMDVSAG